MLFVGLMMVFYNINWFEFLDGAILKQIGQFMEYAKLKKKDKQRARTIKKNEEDKDDYYCLST